MNRLKGKSLSSPAQAQESAGATAELFAEEGAAVVIAERDESTGRDAAKQIETSRRKSTLRAAPTCPTRRACKQMAAQPSRLSARSTSW